MWRRGLSGKRRTSTEAQTIAQHGGGRAQPVSWQGGVQGMSSEWQERALLGSDMPG